MGPWRALMGSARGRPRYFLSSVSSSSSSFPSDSLFYSSSSLAKAQQNQPCPLTPNARFVTPSHESHNGSTRLSESIWPALGLGFVQKNGQQNVETVLRDAKDFWLDSSSEEGLGRSHLKLSAEFLQPHEQTKAWLIARASPAEFAAGTLSFKKPWVNAGASLDDTKSSLMGFLKQYAPKCAEDVSSQFSMHDAAIKAPGFCELGDCVIHADSVKRKRKKKMNKHKHRKLRRLARRSHK